MSNRLSHSSLNRFQDCPKSFDLHYNKGLRGTTQSAALLFGTAIDKAVENLVNTKDLDKAKGIFNTLWLKQEINGVLEDLTVNPNIVFANNDLDVELLDNVEVYLSLTEIIDKKSEVGFDNLSTEDKIVYNSANWWVAKKRGELMLEAVYKDILPRVKKVHSTQEKIDLTNGSGDNVIGYIDMVAEFDDYKEPIVLDWKTSTRDYDDDAVQKSSQLALYTHALSAKYKTRKAGFIVLSKQIQKNRKKVCSVCNNDGSGGRHKTCNAEPVKGKRCNGEWIETIDPKARIQVLISDIPEQLENIVMENVDDINKIINAGIFSRNLTSCVKPYGPCTFFKLCHHNSMEGLIKK